MSIILIIILARQQWNAKEQDVECFAKHGDNRRHMGKGTAEAFTMKCKTKQKKSGKN
jgi:hypothetical protein